MGFMAGIRSVSVLWLLSWGTNWVHANSFSQNFALFSLLMKPPHALGSHLAKKIDTEEVC